MRERNGEAVSGSVVATEALIPLGYRGSPPAERVSTAFDRLVRELDEVGWVAAFERYWLSLGSGPRPVLPPADGRMNWVWLTDLDRSDVAVDLGSPFGDVAATLALTAPTVRYVGGWNAHGEIVSRRFAGTGVEVLRRAEGAESGTADLAAFTGSPGWRERLPERARGGEVARMAHGVLRRGGWFGAVVGNPFGGTRLARWPRPSGATWSDARLLGGLRRGIRAAGFTEVREYFCATSLDIPEVVVPRTLAAVRAYATITGMSGQRARLLARGIVAPLFPCLLLLARK